VYEDRELIRVSVFEAKLLTQTDCPVGARAGATAPLPVDAIRIGGPSGRPDRASIRATVPVS
jgi:hypothetical protein